MDAHNWLIMQVLFSITVILVNIVLFHLLNVKKDCDNNNNNAIFRSAYDVATTSPRVIGTTTATTTASLVRLGMLKKFGMSLSLLHVLSGACLLVITVISLLTHHISGFYPSLGHMEIFTLLMTLTCNMFHMLGIMINDFKTACRAAVLAEENNFYIFFMWTSTLVCTVLMFLVKLDAELANMFSYIFLATDAFLILCYIDIVRRSIVTNQRRMDARTHQVGLYNNMAVRRPRDIKYGLVRWHSHYHHLFLGVLLTTTYVVFSVPFALERFLWRKNFMVSYICVALNSISQGVIFGIRAYVK